MYTYSSSAMMLFSEYGYFKTLEEINLYMKNKKSTYEIRSCENETIFQRMIKQFMRLIGMFQDYLLPILLLYILIDYTLKIRNELSNVQGLIGNFKLSFIFMNVIIMLSLLGILYPVFMEKFTKFIRSENK
jgi:putative flippase GtrA